MYHWFLYPSCNAYNTAVLPSRTRQTRNSRINWSNFSTMQRKLKKKTVPPTGQDGLYRGPVILFQTDSDSSLMNNDTLFVWRHCLCLFQMHVGSSETDGDTGRSGDEREGWGDEEPARGHLGAQGTQCGAPTAHLQDKHFAKGTTKVLWLLYVMLILAVSIFQQSPPPPFFSPLVINTESI